MDILTIAPPRCCRSPRWFHAAVGCLAAVSAAAIVGCGGSPASRPSPEASKTPAPFSLATSKKTVSGDVAATAPGTASQASPPTPKAASISLATPQIAVVEPPPAKPGGAEVPARPKPSGPVPQDIKTVARPPTFVEPRPASPIRIEYPEEARKFGQQGVVEIELTVNESGVVTAARVASSSGVPLLDEAAHRVLSAARFEPARRNGLAVPYTFRQAVRFVLRLQDKSPAK